MRSPGLEFSSRDSRLRAMVQNKWLTRMHIHEAHRLRQMPRVDQDVVDESGVTQHADPAIERLAKDELIGRLILDNVSQPSQFGVLSKVCKGLGKICRCDRGPADNTLHPSSVSGLLGQTQQPAGLLKALPRLYGNRSRDTSVIEQWL